MLGCGSMFCGTLGTFSLVEGGGGLLVEAAHHGKYFFGGGGGIDRLQLVWSNDAGRNEGRFEDLPF